MKRLWLLPFFLLLTGCVTYETYEERITVGEDAPLSVTMEFGNLSTGEDASKVDAEFQELVAMVEGDRLLVDAMEAGIYVKERALFVQNGKVFGRIAGIRKDLDRHEDLRATEDGTVLELKKTGGFPVLLATNGQAAEDADVLRVVWPKDARELHWKVRHGPTSENARKNRPHFLKKAESYIEGGAS
jgi:hypothetical protein